MPEITVIDQGPTVTTTGGAPIVSVLAMGIAGPSGSGGVSFGPAGNSAVGDAATPGIASTVSHSDHAHGREAFGAAPAVTEGVGQAAAAGTAVTPARSDHVHPMAAAGAPAASAVGDASLTGSATTPAASDHKHAREAFAAPTAATTYGLSAVTGTAATLAHSDHTHGTPALTTTPPATTLAIGTAAALGTATLPALADHVHPVAAAATPTTSAVGDAAATGAATTYSSSNHVHGRESFGTPGSSAVADTVSAGASASPARADHRHGRESFGTPGSSAVGDAVAAGAAATPARSDHIHGREAFGNVVALTSFGTASGNGAAATLARSDHVHGAPANYGHYDLPSQHGLLDWNFPSKQATSGKLLATSGAVYLMALRPMASVTWTNLCAAISTAGVGLSNCFIGAYSQNGTTATLLSSSADQSTAWQSGGGKTAALGAAQAVTSGAVDLVAIVATWATTAPTFLGTAAANSSVFNFGQSASSPFEFGIFSSALSALPATITMASITGGNTALPIWIGSS